MSTLIAQTLSNGTVSTSTANCIQGSAKAWVNYKGTATVSIRASYNVSSVTVNGTGDYTVNFTNALTDANYSCVLTGAVSTARLGSINDSAAAPTSSACRVLFATTSGTSADSAYVMASFFR